MNIHKSIVALLLTICWSALSYGQDCVSFTGPIVLNDQVDTVLVFPIYNLDSIDLSTSNQGVCKVNIHFETEYPRDLQIILVSPFGEEISLTGPIIQNSGDVLPGTSWDISFVPLDSTASPDAGYSSQWSNDQQWLSNLFFPTVYTGTYYPFVGDIGTIRQGFAYGEWKLKYKDGLALHNSTLHSFSIEFCNPSGIDCKECLAEADTLNPTTINYCENDPNRSLEFSDFLIDTTHIDNLPADFIYNAVIVQNDTVIDYRIPTVNDSISFTGLTPGRYEVYGMVYDTLYKMDVPDPDSTFTIDSLRNMMDSLPRIFCGDLTMDALTIFINPIDTTYLTLSICNGDSLVVGDSIFRSSIMTEVGLTNQYDCDSIIIIDLEVITIPLTVIDTILCLGDSLEFNGVWYTENTNQLFKLTSTNQGCDSTVLLDIEYHPYNFREIDEEICDGDSFSFFGTELNSTGVFRDSTIGVNGCDSVVQLNLNVVTTFMVDTTTTLCAGDTFYIDTERYFTTGLYSHTFSSTLGCDSMVNLDLTIVEPMTYDVSEIICSGDSILLGNQYYKEAGEFVDTLVSSIGCDSIVMLELEVITIPLTVIDTILCFGDSLAFNGDWYSETTNQSFTLTSTNQGCDSTVLLDLRFHPYNFREIDEEICDGEVFSFFGMDLTSTGEYRDSTAGVNGCDSVVLLNLNIITTFVVDTMTTLCAGDTFYIDTEKYFTTGLYSHTFLSSLGCDSMVNLDLTIVEPIIYEVSEIICSGDSLLFDNQYYKETGVYTDTLMSSIGCDSIIIVDLEVISIPLTVIDTILCFGDSLAFNGNWYSETTNQSFTLSSTAQGCDSIVLLDLRFHSYNFSEIDEEICGGDAFSFFGRNLNSSGVYRDSTLGVNGCDSVVLLNLNVITTFVVDTMTTLCAGDTFYIDTEKYFTTGLYSHTFLSSLGCDSMVNLDLTIVEPAIYEVSEIICSGDSLLFDNQYYKETGVYTDTLMSSIGCDSIIIVDLEVISIPLTVIDTILCFGDSLAFNGDWYSETTNQSFTLSSTAQGCDSTVLLDLRFHPYNFREIDQEICSGDAFPFFGRNLNSTGIYRDSTLGVNGCDSVVLLNLSVVTTFMVDTLTTLCAGDTFYIDTEKYFTTGLYSHTFPSSLGCDSMVNLDLTIVEPSIYDVSETLCFGDSIHVGNQFYKETGQYVDTLMSSIGCDSIVNLDLIIRPQNEFMTTETICFGDSIESAGRYYKANGIYRDTLIDQFLCDSIVILDLTVSAENKVTISEMICFGQSISVGDSIYSRTGIFETVLQDINNCDSIVVLDLIIMDQVTSTMDAILCRGDSIMVGAEYFSETGNYEVIIARIDACDSTVMINLEIVEPIIVNLPAQLCEGEPYTLGVETYHTEGIYRDTFQSLLTGCDSVVILDLKYDPVYLMESFESKCTGDSSFFDNRWIKETGIYDDTLKTVVNCDSIMRLHLTFLSLDDPIMLFETRCYGDSILFDGGYLKENGIYRDTLISSTFCDSLVILDLSFRNEQLITTSLTICLGDTMFFQNTFLTTTGTYPYVYQDINGCDSTIILDLLVEQCPLDLVVLNASAPTCAGIINGSIEFIVDYGALKYAVFLLKDGLPVDVLNIFQPNQVSKFENLDIGNYTLQIFSVIDLENQGDALLYNFTFQLTSEISLTDLMISDYNGFGVSCFGTTDGQISFGIDGGIRPYNITWSDNSTDSIRMNLSADDYTITVTDNRGCIDSFDITLTQPVPLIFDIMAAAPSCTGRQDAEIQFVNVSGGTGSYLYNIGFGNQESPLFKDLSSETYILSVEDSNGCMANDLEVINDPAGFSINLGDNLTVDNPADVQLSLSSNSPLTSITWSPDDNLSCMDCPNPIASITNTISYRVTAVSQSGCTAEDQITVILDIDRTVDPAQAFTPNGDGINDIFIVHGNSSIAEVSNIEIYSRSGEMVWKQESFPINDPSFGWDGTYKGEPMTSQLLGYFVEVIYIDGKTRIFKGQLALIR